jgi:catechol 2,3-dioxygenase
MQVEKLGHVVIKVRSVERSEDFYSGVLGIPVAARLTDPMRMTFFTLGNHHDFAAMEVGADAPAEDPAAIGLAHFAFKVGNTFEELQAAKADLEEKGVGIHWALDHTVTKSIYLRDPDGNEVELYVDASDVWKTDPDAVMEFAPLEV